MTFRSFAPWFLVSLGVLVALGCGTRGDRPGTRPTDAGTGPIDAGGDEDAGFDPINPCAPACGDAELCGDTGEGNGLDDDCDGTIDEDCACPAVGVTLPCFDGPPDRRNVGACADGVQHCTEFLTWGACVGGVAPSPESCDGVDNDCNAITDDLDGCSSAVTCPGNDMSPPLDTYRLRGDRVYTGAARSWGWRVECPPSVPADLCPAPSSPTDEDTDVYFTASGAYRVYVDVETDDGTPASCAWTVYVQGTGLRVELNWDTMLDTAGGTDVDLHLHRWTQNGVDRPWFGPEDCYYGNCTPRGGSSGIETISWPDHASSELSKCDDAPHGGGAAWSEVGHCRNPRLDVDTNGIDGACRSEITDPANRQFCAPENINVDNPIVGMPYRVMVNYYSDSGHAGMTNTSVNIYCGGAIRGAFGLDPLVYLTEGGGGDPFSGTFGPQNESWIVANVVFFTGTCGLDCMVYPLGHKITGRPDPRNPLRTTLEFGPEWTCDYDQIAGTCTP